MISLPVTHPDVLEFITIKTDLDRVTKANISVRITDDFMRAVENVEKWELKDTLTGKVTEVVDALDLWLDILKIRKTETGEPYLLFIDTVNRDNPEEYKTIGATVYSSNICTEIVGFTSPEYTAVCCLASINVANYDYFKDSIDTVVADVSDFLDSVLTYTENTIKGFTGNKRKAFQRVLNFIKASREIGIGIMGLATYFQSKRVPFESPMAKAINKNIMQSIQDACVKRQASVAKSELCELSKKAGTHKRNLHSIAIAPTISISVLSGLVSAGIEPVYTNIYTKKGTTGSYTVKNQQLDAVLIERLAKKYQGEDISTHLDDAWQRITEADGSVQGLDDILTEYDRDVFKTAFEINQLKLISLASDRQAIMVNQQSQSVNLFIPNDTTWDELHSIHFYAWKAGLKSLYYLRSNSDVRPSVSGKPIELKDISACVDCAG